MKKIIALVLVAMLACAAVAAVAETKITVSGKGEVLVPADTAVVSLGVNERDEDVLAAQNAVNEKIEAIRTALMEAGIAKEDINTDRLHIYAVYDYSQEMERIAGYNASSYLAIRTTNMENVGKIIDIAFAAGANSLDNVQFSASETDEAAAEAMKAAVMDARAKAEVIAAASGMTIERIETISEGSTYSYDSGVNAFYKNVQVTGAEGAAAAETLVQAAKVSVTTTLNVVYIAK